MKIGDSKSIFAQRSRPYSPKNDLKLPDFEECLEDMDEHGIQMRVCSGLFEDIDFPYWSSDQKIEITKTAEGTFHFNAPVSFSFYYYSQYPEEYDFDFYGNYNLSFDVTYEDETLLEDRPELTKACDVEVYQEPLSSAWELDVGGGVGCPEGFIISYTELTSGDVDEADIQYNCLKCQITDSDGNTLLTGEEAARIDLYDHSADEICRSENSANSLTINLGENP